MLKSVRHILEMIRFSHTLFALPFAIFAALLAWMQTAYDLVRVEMPTLDGLFHFLVAGPTIIKPELGDFVFWTDVVGILLCMVFARSASMAFNRIVDRDIDAENPRTSTRHIPAGVLSVRSVAIFAVVCSLGFIGSTLLFLPNPLPLYLSVPVLAFLFGYSYAKRFTAWSHAWLGAALMLAPVSAWIAIRGQQVMANPADLLPALVLGVAVLLWVTGFDIIYACQDAAFDRQRGLRSVPARFGIDTALLLASLCHMGMIIALVLLPWVYDRSMDDSSARLGLIYWSGVGVVAVLLAYEHWLVRPDDLRRVNQAFFYVNAIISIGLLAIGAFDLLT